MARRNWDRSSRRDHAGKIKPAALFGWADSTNASSSLNISSNGVIIRCACIAPAAYKIKLVANWSTILIKL